MSKLKKTRIFLVSSLVLLGLFSMIAFIGSTNAYLGDQIQDQDRDQDCDCEPDQIQDQIQDQDRDQDCDCEPDQIQDQIQDQDCIQ